MFTRLMGIILCLLLACSSTPKQVRLSGETQGTIYRVKYFDRNYSPEKQRQIEREIESVFSEIDKSLSNYDTASWLYRTNYLGETFVKDQHFKSVFRQSQKIFQISNGAFDPTVETYKSNIEGVNSLKKQVSFADVSLSENDTLKKPTYVKLTFDAIAQGYTVDMVAEVLNRHNVQSYLIDIGGEVYAQGMNEDKHLEWVVGVDAPEKSRDGELILKLKIRNRCIATSGNYRKFVVQKDRSKAGHIIPPKNYTQQNRVMSVSVIHTSCAMADALATAIFVLGEDYENQIEEHMLQNFQTIMMLQNGKEIEMVFSKNFEREMVLE